MKLEDKIAVMQAFLNGYKVQVLSNGAWFDAFDPTWDWENYLFRVKPMSRYLNIYPTGARVAWSTGTRNQPDTGCIGYLEDKQDGSPIVFHQTKE